MAVNKDFVVKNGLQVGGNTSISGDVSISDSITLSNTELSISNTKLLVANSAVATETFVLNAVSGVDNTDEIAEGNTNIFYTDERVQTYLDSGLTVNNSLTISQSLTVDGDFTVSGNTTTVNTNELTIEDLNIVLASGANTAADADGAGLTIDGANATLTYESATDVFAFNKHFKDGTIVDRTLNIVDQDYYTGNYPWRLQDQGGSFQIFYYNAPNMFTIKDNGNVGIGTDSPSVKFEVSSTSQTTQYISTTSTTSEPQLIFIDGSADYFAMQKSDRAMTFKPQGSTTFTIDSSGVSTPGSANATSVNATTITATDLYGNLNGSVANTTLNYSTTTLADGAGSQGNFYFDALNQKLKVHTGSVWVDAVPAGSGSTGNTGSTDANTTFRKYTYDISSTTNSVSGADNASNTLTYVTTGEQNVEAFVNGVKQVEGASNDYVATTGTSVTFTSNLSAGDNVEIQVYELLTNDAYYLKTETYTQTETNQQITTALGGYVPKTGGTFTGAVTTSGSLEIENSEFFISNSSNSSVFSKISMNIDNTNNVARIRSSYNGGGTLLPLNFYMANDEAMSIRTDRDVYFTTGTRSDLYKSHTYSAQSYLDFDDDSGTNDNSTTLASISGLNFITDTNNNGHIPFRFQSGNTSVASAYTHVFIDTMDGSYTRVGIDTTDPQYTLDVDGTARFHDTMRVWDGANTTPETYVSWNAQGGLVGTGSNHDFNLRSNGTNRVTLDTSGHLYPRSTTQDLGTANNAWRNIYTQDLVLSNEARDSGNEVDGTKGNWTIQEGEDHLYIINNKNGKKYKFALEEIE